MRKASALLLSLAAVSGCGRDGPPPPRPTSPESVRVGPILAEQTPELLSKPGDLVAGGTRMHQANFRHSLYTRADPGHCPFMVAEESPLLPKGPAAENSSWWDTDGLHSIIEVAAVYPQGFDAARFLADARRQLEPCYDTHVFAFTDSGQRNTGIFRRGPQAGTANEQFWSWGEADVWSCSYGLVAKYNAVVEVASCEERETFDLQALVLAKELQMDRISHPKE